MINLNSASCSCQSFLWELWQFTGHFFATHEMEGIIGSVMLLKNIQEVYLPEWTHLGCGCTAFETDLKLGLLWSSLFSLSMFSFLSALVPSGAILVLFSTGSVVNSFSWRVSLNRYKYQHLGRAGCCKEWRDQRNLGLCIYNGVKLPKHCNLEGDCRHKMLNK